MFILTIFKKVKHARLKVSQGSVTVLQNMANDQEAIFMLTNEQSAAKN